MRLKSNFSKYDVQEGFEEPPNHSEEFVQIPKKENQSIEADIIKNRSLSKKQQAKLRFISIEREKSHSSHYTYLKQEQQKLIHKSLTFQKEQSSFLSVKKRNKLLKPIHKLQPMDNFRSSIIKQERQIFNFIKARLQIGENIQIKEFNEDEVKVIKEKLISKGASLVFQSNTESNSHALFKKFLKAKTSFNFLKSKYNSSLLQKLNQSFINPKFQLANKINSLGNKKPVQFISGFESSNLDFVTQINPFEYDVYLKADTNTLGHQNWFYFKLFNNTEEKKRIFVNVCNLKRTFKMIKRGQKIYSRNKKVIQCQVKTSIQNQQESWTEWQKLNDQISISKNETSQQNKVKKHRTYKLSFSCCMEPKTENQFSLLPPYTYSEMLKELQTIEEKCKNVDVQILTFSLLGLSIPIATFTKKSVSNEKKQAILISSRVHPGQTCGSFVLSGILNKLSQQSDENQELLSKYVIKIIPMLNPDGVVLGNFRTNYLGNDLNRSFNQTNELIFPEIIGLKELGKKLKIQFKERFLCFLDLHGHSSQKNIFAYGPNYDEHHKNFVSSRFFPKYLNFLSQQFDYNKCTFNLEQCKSNTARGYFLTALKVMAYTIQSSYALYDSNKNTDCKNMDLKPEKWHSFGRVIVEGIGMWMKSLQKRSPSQKIDLKEENLKSSIDLQKNNEDLDIIVLKLKKQIKKQSLLSRKNTKVKKNQDENQQSSQQDSDGESESEDISQKQRQKIERRLIQSNIPSYFPRILRPAIVHPEVNPPAPLFIVNKIGAKQQKKGNLNISIANVRMKRNRYQNIKPMNVNNAYTQYLLKEVKGLQSLKPSVQLMKLQRKESLLLQSTKISNK